MRSVRSEAGGSKIVVLFLLVVVFLAVQTGVKLVPMYMDAQSMKDEMAAQAAAAQTKKDVEILNDLAGKARDLGLPLKAEDFVLDRDPDTNVMTISTSWDVTQHLLFNQYIRTFHFAPQVTGAKQTFNQ